MKQPSEDPSRRMVRYFKDAFEHVESILSPHGAAICDGGKEEVNNKSFLDEISYRSTSSLPLARTKLCLSRGWQVRVDPNNLI